jgi:hypothetical protein
MFVYERALQTGGGNRPALGHAAFVEWKLDSPKEFGAFRRSPGLAR